jgi:chromosome segregation ATPase
MGGIIPRNIKIKVIRDWLNGLTREEIVKKNDIGAGTVTGIIQEARKQEEYSDIDLLREVSRKLKEEGLALPSLAFAIRLQRIMEENDINEDQIEPIIQEFATYCLRYQIPYEIIVKVGREALYLEQKFGVPIEKVSEYIVHGKQTIDRIEDQRQEILGQKQLAEEELDAKRQELDTIAAKLEKYRKEIPLIQRIIELENELEEEKRKNEHYKIGERALIKERDSADREAMRLRADVIELDAKNETLARKLSICINELDKLKRSQQINQSQNSND